MQSKAVDTPVTYVLIASAAAAVVLAIALMRVMARIDVLQLMFIVLFQDPVGPVKIACPHLQMDIRLDRIAEKGRLQQWRYFFDMTKDPLRLQLVRDSSGKPGIIVCLEGLEAWH